LWQTLQDREAVVSELQRHGFFHNRSQKMQAKSGEIRDFLFSAETTTIGGEPIIISTWHDITEMKKIEDALKASLGEKEVLLKEIHHRVKNNLQVICSLVSLQAEQCRDPVARAVLEDVTHRVHSMAMIHEKLYQST